MPSATLNEMILGYAVILGVLVLYVLTLIIRIHKVKKHPHKRSKE